MEPLALLKDEGRSKQRRRARRAAERALSTQESKVSPKNVQEELGPSETKISEGPSLLHPADDKKLSQGEIWKVSLDHDFADASGFGSFKNLTSADTSSPPFIGPPGLGYGAVNHLSPINNYSRELEPGVLSNFGLSPPGLFGPASVVPIQKVYPAFMSNSLATRGTTDTNNWTAGVTVLGNQSSDIRPVGSASVDRILAGSYPSTQVLNVAPSLEEAGPGQNIAEQLEPEKWRKDVHQHADEMRNKFFSPIRAEDLERELLAAAVAQGGHGGSSEKYSQNVSKEKKKEANLEACADSRTDVEASLEASEKDAETCDPEKQVAISSAKSNSPQLMEQKMLDSKKIEENREENVIPKPANDDDTISSKATGKILIAESQQDSDKLKNQIRPDLHSNDDILTEGRKIMPKIAESPVPSVLGSKFKRRKKDTVCEENIIKKIPVLFEESELIWPFDDLMEYFPWMTDVVGPLKRYIDISDVYLPLIEEGESSSVPHDDLISVSMDHYTRMKQHFTKRLAASRKKKTASNATSLDPFYSFIEAVICRAALQKEVKDRKEIAFLSGCLVNVYCVMSTLFVDEIQSGDSFRRAKISHFNRCVKTLLEFVFQVSQEYETEIVDMLSRIKEITQVISFVLPEYIGGAEWKRIVEFSPMGVANLLTIEIDLRLSVIGANVRDYEEKVHRRMNMLLEPFKTRGLFDTKNYIEQEYKKCATRDITEYFNRLKRYGGELLTHFSREVLGNTQRGVKPNKSLAHFYEIIRLVCITAREILNRDSKVNEPFYADIVSWLSVYSQELASKLKFLSEQAEPCHVEFDNANGTLLYHAVAEITNLMCSLVLVETSEFEYGRESQRDMAKFYNETMYDFLSGITNFAETYSRENSAQTTYAPFGLLCLLTSLRLAYCYRIFDKPHTENSVTRYHREDMKFAISQVKHEIKSVLEYLFRQKPPTLARRRLFFRRETHIMDSLLLPLPGDYYSPPSSNCTSLWDNLDNDWRESGVINKILYQGGEQAADEFEAPELVEHRSGEDDKDVMEAISKLELERFDDGLDTLFNIAPMKEVNAKAIVRDMMSKPSKINIITEDEPQKWEDYSFKSIGLNAQQVAENWNGRDVMNIRLDDLNDVLCSKKEQFDSIWNDYCLSLKDPRLS